MLCFDFRKGANSHGQLAIGSTEDKDAPTRVPISLKPDFITGGGIFSVLVESGCLSLFTLLLV